MEFARNQDRDRPMSSGHEWRTGTLDAVLAATPDCVYLCDRAGTILYVNVSGAEHWGLEREELLGMTWPELGLPRATIETLRVQREAVFDTGRSLVSEVELTAQGVTNTWQTMLTPMQGEGGRVEVVVIAFRDISQSKRAALALRESEEKYRLLAENSTDMISRHEPDGTYLYVSPACRTLVGYEPEELIGRSPYDFVHPNDLFELSTTHERILESTETFTIVFRALRKDGRLIWFESTVRTIRDPTTDEVVEIQCASRDVSARKEAEEALRESQEQLQAILDNSTAVIYVKDSEGRYILVNQWYETLFKLPRDWIIGKTDHEIFPREQADVVRANDREVLCKGKPIAFEEVIPHDEGLHTYISNKFPLRTSSGSPWAVGGISSDITDRKRTEEQLLRQNELLLEAVRSERQAHDALKRAESQLVHAEKLTALGQLVAGVAHEINNPLAFVTSDVSVLKREVGHLRDLLTLCLEASDTLAVHRPELLAKIRELSERVDLPFMLENLDGLLNRSSEGLRRIRQIVKDLRDFARLDERDFKDVNLNEGIASTVNIIRGRARTKGVELTTDLTPLPTVACYPGELNQVLLNLLSNAIDATDPGGRVTVRTHAVENGVEIQVADTGKGIDPVIRHKIFDPFFTTKPVGEGTGLGLSVSYGIVRSHGGTIDVESEPGQGATFIVRLPLKAAEVEPTTSIL
ncbi:PAS domain S-box protein [Singulisphaera acidiphila]|uniref:histidine kinase n=1 Tax=Singulisphaera acidiphila (strain ATCC BAA-1392 / DSM 18658 / VKM B-2454 / MOB10) TaxID=886293 RepID=L0DJ52_SINAD|nr:PAS domain S-box protein [Singulisphaera acidiphila]AGA28853.1 PAS domain S-box [Singulisphaera acidiphila DSM 18658]